MDGLPEPMDILTARIPAALKKWLVELAQQEHRSASQQLTVILEKSRNESEDDGKHVKIVTFHGASEWKPEE